MRYNIMMGNRIALGQIKYEKQEPAEGMLIT